MSNETYEPKILIITTETCSYPGVDNAGQKHLQYSPSTYCIRTLDPVIFDVNWYLEVFKAGYDGIYIASCGTDSPYVGTYDKLSKRISVVVQEMKKMGLHYSQIKLTAVCTVCADHFVHELSEFIDTVRNNMPKVAA